MTNAGCSRRFLDGNAVNPDWAERKTIWPEKEIQLELAVRYKRA